MQILTLVMRLLYFLLPLSSGFLFSGATRPLGFWDPLELSKSLEVGHLAFMREAELKHSRWSMISLISMPLIESYTHYPATYHITNAPLQLKILIVTLIGLGEFNTLLRGWENPFLNHTNTFKLDPEYQPGDFGLGIRNGLSFFTEDTLNNFELNHGRLAMITSIIVIVLEVVNNTPLFASKSIELL